MIHRSLFEILITHTLKEVLNGDYLKKAREKPNIEKGHFFFYVKTKETPT